MSNGSLGGNGQTKRMASDYVPLSTVSLFTIQIPHSINRAPDNVFLTLRNKTTAENGYMPGEEVPLTGLFNGEGPAVACANGLVTVYCLRSNLRIKLKTNPGASFTPSLNIWEVRATAVWFGGL
jgi:hypothetical protein